MDERAGVPYTGMEVAAELVGVIGAGTVFVEQRTGPAGATYGISGADRVNGDCSVLSGYGFGISFDGQHTGCGRTGGSATTSGTWMIEDQHLRSATVRPKR